MENRLFSNKERKELQKQMYSLINKTDMYHPLHCGMVRCLDKMRECRKHFTNSKEHKQDDPKIQELIRDWDEAIKDLEMYVKMMDVVNN